MTVDLAASLASRWRVGGAWGRLAVVAAGVLAPASGALVAREPGAGSLVVLAAVGSVGLLLLPPRTMLIGLLLFVALVPGTTWGLGEATSATTAYSRGSGLLGVPGFELAVGLLAGVLIVRRRDDDRSVSPLAVGLALLIALYLVHVAVGVLRDVPLAQALDGTGGRLLLTVAAAYAASTVAVRNVQDMRLVLSALAWIGAGLAVFGLGRFLFLSGDTTNPYLEYSGIAVKLTFFEVANAVVLAYTFFWFFSERRRGMSWMPARPVAWFLAGMATVTIFLSFRRSNWLGFLIGVAFLLVATRRRRLVAVVLLLVGLMTVNFLAVERGLPNVHGEVVTGGGLANGPRVGEMQLAAESIARHPLGEGPMGAYDGNPGAGWPAPPSIVHNAILWVGVKLGVPGMILLSGLVVFALALIFRAGSRAAPGLRGVRATLAGVGGLWIANIAFGTPLLETRLAVLFGVWLGLVARYARLPAEVSVSSENRRVTDDA